MLAAGRRVAAIALNTYREAVRARILLGLSALALATALYSIAVGEFALKNAPRVVADLGAASVSMYAIVAAVIIGVTSLYRELEQKTIFPILARPISRAEYIVGKYLGMAVVLTIALIRLLTEPSTSFGELVLFFVMQMAVGTVIGIAMGEIMRRCFNWLDLELEGIYPVLSVALALLTYGLTAFLHGSGFLAVYMAGLVMQRRPFTHQQSILRFHDGLAWLMQVTMFLMLGLQVFPARLVPIAWVGLLISLFLIFVARPASVHTALAFSPMSYKEQTLVAWAGLRGAVPIILATFPLLAGVKQADTIFHMVFFIAVTSVVMQGTAIPWITRALKIEATPSKAVKSGLPLDPRETDKPIL